MPGKARRVASRQAQLNRRRKKQQKGPSGVPSAMPAPAEVDGHTGGDIASQAEEPAAFDPSGSRAPAVRPAAVAARPAMARPPHSGPRSRGERPATYNYIGAELRRILVRAGAVLAALIVLGILL